MARMDTDAPDWAADSDSSMDLDPDGGERANASEDEVAVIYDAFDMERREFGDATPGDAWLSEAATDDDHLDARAPLPPAPYAVGVVVPDDSGHCIMPDGHDEHAAILVIRPQGAGAGTGAAPFKALPQSSVLSISHFVVPKAKAAYLKGEPLSNNSHFARYIVPLVIVAIIGRVFKASQLRLYFDVCAVRTYEKSRAPQLADTDTFQSSLPPTELVQQFSRDVTERNCRLINRVAIACDRASRFWNVCAGAGASMMTTLCHTLWYITSGYSLEYYRHWTHCAQLLAVDFTGVRPEWYHSHYEKVAVGGALDNVLHDGYLASVYRIYALRQRRPLVMGGANVFAAPKYVQVRDCHQTAPSYGDYEHTHSFNQGEYWRAARYEWCIPLTYTPQWTYTEFDKSVPAAIFCYVNAKRLAGETGAIMTDAHYATSFGLLWRSDAVQMVAKARHFLNECRFHRFTNSDDACYYDDDMLRKAGVRPEDRQDVRQPGSNHKLVHDHYMAGRMNAHHYFTYGIDEILAGVGLGYMTADTPFRPAFPDGESDAALSCYRKKCSEGCDELPTLRAEHTAHHDEVAVNNPTNELSKIRFDNSNRGELKAGSMLADSVVLTMHFGWGFDRLQVWSIAGERRLYDLTRDRGRCGSIKLSQTAFAFFFPHLENRHNVWGYRAFPSPGGERSFEVVPPADYEAVAGRFIEFFGPGPVAGKDKSRWLSFKSGRNRVVPNMHDTVFEKLDPRLILVLADRIDPALENLGDNFFANIPTRQRRLQEAVAIFAAWQSNMSVARFGKMRRLQKSQQLEARQKQGWLQQEQRIGGRTVGVGGGGVGRGVEEQGVGGGVGRGVEEQRVGGDRGVIRRGGAFTAAVGATALAVLIGTIVQGA